MTEDDIRTAVRAALTDALADMLDGLVKGTTTTAQAHSAPQRPALASTPTEPEWAGLATAEPPAPTETRVTAPPNWPDDECPRHHREWKQGKFGPYCTSQEPDPQYANSKGYCRLRPGDLYQGRLIPRPVA